MDEQWESGTRRRVPRWLVAVLAVAVLVGVGVLAKPGETPDRDLSIETDLPASEAPRRRIPSALTADGPQRCKPATPVAVVGRTAYPAGFPDAPAVTPSRCFRDERGAAEAGFAIAKTPLHVQRVGGLYLVPITESAFQTCVRIADLADHEIPCPGRRPFGGEISGCVTDCVTGGGFLFSLRRIPAPPHWCGTCVPDLIVTAAPVGAPEVVTALTRCGPRNGGHRQSGTFFCDQVPGASLIQSHAQHTMRRGRHNRIFYAVSVHGRGKAQRALVNRIYDSLIFVGR